MKVPDNPIDFERGAEITMKGIVDAAQAKLIIVKLLATAFITLTPEMIKGAVISYEAPPARPVIGDQLWSNDRKDSCIVRAMHGHLVWGEMVVENSRPLLVDAGSRMETLDMRWLCFENGRRCAP